MYILALITTQGGKPISPRANSRDYEEIEHWIHISQNFSKKGYSQNLIEEAFTSHLDYIKSVKDCTAQQRPGPLHFITQYHPKYLFMEKIIQKHWNILLQDPILQSAFTARPLVTYGRARNLESHIALSKPTKKKKNPSNTILQKLYRYIQASCYFSENALHKYFNEDGEFVTQYVIQNHLLVNKTILTNDVGFFEQSNSSDRNIFINASLIKWKNDQKEKLYRYIQASCYFSENALHKYFNEDGEFVTQYVIQNHLLVNKTILTNDVGFFEQSNSSDRNIFINASLIKWKNDQKEIPRSQCSEDCLPGKRKVPSSNIHECCYDCVPCSEGEMSNETGSENCMKCLDHEWPNENKTECNPKQMEFLSYTDNLSLFFMVISLFLCILTFLTMIVFIAYGDTPIVRANNKSLSFVLLVSIMLGFLCVFLFLGRPLDTTCWLRQTSFGFLFTIAVSSVLGKTVMVWLAFKATKPGSVWKKWVGVKLPNVVVFICSSLQVLICIAWLSISPPCQELEKRSYQTKIIVQCNEGSVIGFYSVLGYMGILAAVSFISAFLARTLPDSFNEAKYITFSMLVFCSVWIAMIPAYLSTKGKYMVAVEIFAILTSNAGLLLCIFFSKCYIILFYPHLNSRKHLLDNICN
ncbi:vomeronasal type-2 receptor 26-like [Lithobates pipiens]